MAKRRAFAEVSFYVNRGKRLVDVFSAMLGLIMLWPIFIILMFAIWLEDQGQVLFKQLRVGRNGKEFVLYKFRSMPVGTPDIPSASAVGLSLTRVGRILRRINFDELPQLINVLKGDMSLVGPRPALFAQKDVIELRKRNGAYLIRPGLTGLAQINSYDGMLPEHKAEWDGSYANKISFTRDLRIMTATLKYFLKPPPAY